MGFQGRWSCGHRWSHLSRVKKKTQTKTVNPMSSHLNFPFSVTMLLWGEVNALHPETATPPPSPTVSHAVRSTLTLDGWTHSGEEIAFLFPRNNTAPARFFLLICSYQGRKMADLEAVLADVSYLMAMEKSKSTPAARASKKIILPEPR